ncbi:MAG: hypothetical protein KGP29_05560 [Proteobacteria bacterium]|nr:hypothetical protein [Pseudomonadota bacterium]
MRAPINPDLLPLRRAVLGGDLDECWAEYSKIGNGEVALREVLEGHDGNLMVLSWLIKSFQISAKSRAIDGKKADQEFFKMFNTECSLQRTSLHRAVSSPSPNRHVVQMLLQIGVRVDHADSEGLTAFDLARSKGDPMSMECATTIREFDLFFSENPKVTECLNNSFGLLEHIFEIVETIIKDRESSLLKKEAATELISVWGLSTKNLFYKIRKEEAFEEMRGLMLNKCNALAEAFIGKIGCPEDRYSISAVNRLEAFMDFLNNPENFLDPTPDRDKAIQAAAELEDANEIRKEEVRIEKENQLREKIKLEQKNRWKSYIRNLSSSSKNSFLEEFDKSGRDLEATNSLGHSVLRCVIDKCVSRDLAKVLNCENLDFAVLKTELRRVIEAKNQQAVKTFFENDLVRARLASLGSEGIRDFFKDLQTSEEIKKSIREFQSAVSATVEKPVGNQTIRGSKKKSKKVVKGEDLRETNSEKTAQECEVKEGEDSKLFEAGEENPELEEFLTKVTEESAGEISDNLLKEAIAEFSQELFKKFDEEAQQIKTFLSGPRELNSLEDLPLFLRGKIAHLLEKGCEVALKGSAVYQKVGSRIPADLDLEIKVPGIYQKTNEEVASFVFENFDISIDPTKIYRASSGGGSIFSLNIADGIRGLDISIYDPNNMPPFELSWTTNRDSVRAIINSDGSIIKSPCDTDLNINPAARGLILRLCFLETIEMITEKELEDSFNKLRSPSHLLHKELKLDRSASSTELESEVYQKLSQYCQKRNFNKSLQERFLTNLLTALNPRQNDSSDSEFLGSVIKRVFDLKSVPTSSLKGLNAAAKVFVPKDQTPSF